MTEGYWETQYREGKTPWDTDEVNGHFPAAVAEFGIQPCAALEIGCGTGTNAIWFAQQGFDVTAVDVSEEAIRQAEQKAAIADVRCRFIAACAMTMEIEGRPGEPFVEAGLEIKINSPAAFTYVAHLPAWPTKRAFDNGGYEIYPNVCRIAPGALETITAEAIDLLKEMFKE